MDRDNKGHFVKGHISWLKGTKGLIKGNRGTFKKGQKPWNTGKEFTAETRLKMRNIRLGKYTGANSPNWRGGLTPKNKKIRNSDEYKIWRRAILERDGHKCIWCGVAGNGRNLNVDHIKPFAYYPELRFAIDNGRTLCVSCHKTTDTYLYKARKYAR